MDMTTSSCAWSLLLPGNSAPEVFSVSAGMPTWGFQMAICVAQEDAALHCLPLTVVCVASVMTSEH